MAGPLGHGRREHASLIDRAYLEAMSQAKLNPELAAQRLAAIVDLYGNDDGLLPADQESLALARQHLATVEIADRRAAATTCRFCWADSTRRERMESTDPAAARAIREAIIKLYSDKPWAANVVERATADLAARTAAGNHTGSATPQ